MCTINSPLDSTAKSETVDKLRVFRPNLFSKFRGNVYACKFFIWNCWEIVGMEFEIKVMITEPNPKKCSEVFRWWFCYWKISGMFERLVKYMDWQYRTMQQLCDAWKQIDKNLSTYINSNLECSSKYPRPIIDHDPSIHTNRNFR